MAELKYSICFLLVFSYKCYLHEGRRTLRAINHKFKNIFTLSLKSSYGAMECHFKREELRFDIHELKLNSLQTIFQILDR